jgi:membrane fusion protein
MAPMFRPEAVEGRRQAWLGSIQLIRPVSLTLLTLFVLAVALAAAAFLALGQYTRKAHVVGYLAPNRGVIRLLPPLAATVAERRVAEGQTVHEGDVLFVLAIDRATVGGDTQAAVQQSLAARTGSLREAAQQQARLLAEQRAALEQRAIDMQRELTQIDAEADLHRQRLVLAQQALARLQSLQSDHFVSPAQVQGKHEEVLGLQAQLSTLQRQRATQQRDIATLQAQARELPLQASARQGEIERDIAALAQASAESDAKQRIVVRAPRGGVVSTVLADAGQSVTPDVPLASLLPAEARLQAELFAPSSAVGFVRAEQTVLLRYQAYPYQKFGHQSGQVLQVSRTPLQAGELAALPLAGGASSVSTGEPLYRITVALDKQTVDAYGRAQPLSAGMQIDADVLLDRRRLIEWIFEPVLGLAGKV